MEYKYGKNENYEDFASGRVIYSDQGITNFPVRLAIEIFGRCLSYIDKETGVTVYDPCCGGAYLLTILGFNYNNVIGKIIGSDINEVALQTADKNLGLLSAVGLSKRKKELEQLYQQYQKQSHKEAIESVTRFESLLVENEIQVELFRQDCIQPIKHTICPDIIITDVPYGELVEWENDGENHINLMLDRLYDLSSKNTILAVCSNKKQKIAGEKWKRLEKHNIGKRKFELFQKM